MSRSPGLLVPNPQPFLALTAGGLVKFLALMFGPRAVRGAAAAAGLGAPAAGIGGRADWRLLCWPTRHSGRPCMHTAELQRPLLRRPAPGLPRFRRRCPRSTQSTRRRPARSAGAADVGPAIRGALAGDCRQHWPGAAGVRCMGLVAGRRAPDDVAAHALWLRPWFLFLCNPRSSLVPAVGVVFVAIQPWRRWMVLGHRAVLLHGDAQPPAGVFLLPLLGWECSMQNCRVNASTSALITGRRCWRCG